MRLFFAGFAPAIGTLLWLGSSSALAHRVPCASAAGQVEIDAALQRIRNSLDPCGESPQVIALLEKVTRCVAGYQICTDRDSDRNWFDRPTRDPEVVRTITWNPTLGRTIELGCNGDPNAPVQRDATASLLHELAHAAQDCDGLDPDAHELDAVRIENIYRRAAGLCQRSRYGEVRLPAESLRSCEPGACRCTLPVDVAGHDLAWTPPRPEPQTHAGTVTSGDAEPLDRTP